MRTVVRNSFARQSIRAERVHVSAGTCTNCGSVRRHVTKSGAYSFPWLYRFHVDDDQGARQSGPIADGKLFCDRACAESYIGRSFDETK